VVENAQEAKQAKDSGKGAAIKAEALKKKKKDGWKQQSNALRDAMGQQKIIADAEKKGIPLSALPPPKAAAPDPSLVPCPHCGRSFNETAAERHIPKCSTIKAKPTRLNAGAAGGRPTVAKGRAPKKR
jgi:rubrerythrin